jgi:hypothetical protein
MKSSFSGFPSGSSRWSSQAGQASASQAAQQSSNMPASPTPAQHAGSSSSPSVAAARSTNPLGLSSSATPGPATALPPPSSQTLASSSLSLVPRQVAKKIKPTTSVGPARNPASRSASNATPYARSAASQALPAYAPPQGLGVVTQPRGVIFTGGEITAVNAVFTRTNHRSHAARKMM